MSISPISGTTAMLVPKLNAVRSIVLRSCRLGNNAETIVYPGNTRMNNMPSIIRTGPVVNKTIGKRSSESRTIAINIFRLSIII